jgi:hypothetical protein
MNGIRIRVGSQVYTVRVEAMEGAWGRTNYNDSEVRLAEGMGPQAALTTLWHEIHHLVLTELGETKHNEKSVQAVSAMWLATLLDSPDILAALNRAAKKRAKP